MTGNLCSLDEGACDLGVVVADASVAYRGEDLFSHLSVRFPAGRISCLLGPSGVGKSTLLKAIAGLVPSRTGRIAGSDGESLAGRVAYMDQADLLLPWLSARSNVLIGARLRGEHADRSAADALLARVGLDGAEALRPAQLSGGMRQRVALARTLIEDRPVVLMDEPFSSVDALTRFRLQALAADLLANRTVVLVTHDPHEALRLGHGIYVLSGRPVKIDAPIVPQGEPPRAPGQGDLPQIYGDLMRKLGAAALSGDAAGQAA